MSLFNLCNEFLLNNFVSKLKVSLYYLKQSNFCFFASNNSNYVDYLFSFCGFGGGNGGCFIEGGFEKC